MLEAGRHFDVCSLKIWREAFSFPLPSPSPLKGKKITGSSCIPLRVDSLHSVLLKIHFVEGGGVLRRVRWPMSRDKVELWQSPSLTQAIQDEELQGFICVQIRKLFLQADAEEGRVRQVGGVFYDAPSCGRFIGFHMNYPIKGTDKSWCQVRYLILLGVRGLSVWSV